MYTTFALHHINHTEDLPFCEAAYSRFKFGDGQVAQQFGRALAEAFWQQHSETLLAAEKIVCVPSPYDAIPTASFAMTAAFQNTLNLHLYNHGKASTLSSKIHRYKTYTVDYGNLSYEERLELISSDAYHVDKRFLENRLVIFLDDIRITGSHETIIRRQLEREQIQGNFFFVYYALLANKDIAAQFENHLNYFEVNDIQKISGLFKDDDFVMNTRVIKYILKGDSADVKWLMQHAPADRIKELVTYAIGNNYHLMDDYKTNLTSITETINYGY